MSGPGEWSKARFREASYAKRETTPQGLESGEGGLHGRERAVSPGEAVGA